MSADIIKLPTARTSFFTVRKARAGWAVILATPGPGRDTTTIVAKLRTFDDAVAYATHHARRQQLPVKIGRRP